MKGKLHKTETGWVVSYLVGYGLNEQEELPLHPYDAEQIEQDSKRFDNIEARIAAYPDVEFEIENYWETGMESVVRVARLKPDYPELDGLNGLNKNQAINELIDWLENDYRNLVSNIDIIRKAKELRDKY